MLASNNGRAMDLLSEFMQPMFDSMFFHIRCVCRSRSSSLSFISSSALTLQSIEKWYRNAKMTFKIPYL